MGVCAAWCDGGYGCLLQPSRRPDDEGTFSLCTFAYVGALVRADRTAQARLVFEKMLSHANHLGLYAEEISPRGEQCRSARTRRGSEDSLVLTLVLTPADA